MRFSCCCIIHEVGWLFVASGRLSWFVELFAFTRTGHNRSIDLGPACLQ